MLRLHFSSYPGVSWRRMPSNRTTPAGSELSLEDEERGGGEIQKFASKVHCSLLSCRAKITDVVLTLNLCAET